MNSHDLLNAQQDEMRDRKADALDKLERAILSGSPLEIWKYRGITIIDRMKSNPAVSSPTLLEAVEAMEEP